MFDVAEPRLHGSVEQSAAKEEVDVLALRRLHPFGHELLRINASRLQLQRFDVVEHRTHVLHYLFKFGNKGCVNDTVKDFGVESLTEEEI